MNDADAAAVRPAAAPSVPPPGRPERVRGTHPHAGPFESASDGEAAAGRRLPERFSVRDQVLRALRSALVSGELRPGDVYSAPLLAERYGVSATPVREAMQLLAREGAVAAMPNRGFRVAERSARDLAELAEVRALIEVPIVLGLARTIAPERWEALRPLAAATVAAAARGDRAAYAESDRLFHRAMLELSGNLQLVAVADELHRRSQWPVAGPSRTVSRPAELLADATEHSVLLEALVAGDVVTVESLVREHFSGSAWG
ncbi:GntR family transcriptional regulator [Streptomyces sp. H10-C2]|uniref:GntR family transcriptional regulator n=1 Tax=unclassified Streptomyces TaxID=2593676 RepID=UPI0024BA6B2A|nr:MULTISPECIES: GntR family transcriptional regulator [unclassified Streptomyces]MDJ0340740.1 GntR family transcriptional regulator [Streptomyces sp. PH10-H1]MDJ0371988.1 GntR family transcriptional regulator [Streptomyces sp. H10-C2]